MRWGTLLFIFTFSYFYYSSLSGPLPYRSLSGSDQQVACVLRRLNYLKNRNFEDFGISVIPKDSTKGIVYIHGMNKGFDEFQHIAQRDRAAAFIDIQYEIKTMIELGVKNASDSEIEQVFEQIVFKVTSGIERLRNLGLEVAVDSYSMGGVFADLALSRLPRSEEIKFLIQRGPPYGVNERFKKVLKRVDDPVMHAKARVTELLANYVQGFREHTVRTTIFYSRNDKTVSLSEVQRRGDRGNSTLIDIEDYLQRLIGGETRPRVDHDSLIEASNKVPEYLRTVSW